MTTRLMLIRSQMPGSVGADIGCGNGKYMGVNPNVLMIGSDRSHNLVRISKDRGHEVQVADGLDLPYRSHVFVRESSLQNQREFKVIILIYRTFAFQLQ